MLKLELRVGDSVRIGDAIVTLESKSGQIARLSIDAGKNVPIHRVQEPSAAEFARNGIGIRSS